MKLITDSKQVFMVEKTAYTILIRVVRIDEKRKCKEFETKGNILYTNEIRISWFKATLSKMLEQLYGGNSKERNNILYVIK